MIVPCVNGLHLLNALDKPSFLKLNNTKPLSPKIISYVKQDIALWGKVGHLRIFGTHGPIDQSINQWTVCAVIFLTQMGKRQLELRHNINCSPNAISKPIFTSGKTFFFKFVTYCIH